VFTGCAHAYIFPEKALRVEICSFRVACSPVARLIDVMHLGNDRVIGAHELPGGLIVDPGPASCVESLLAGLAEEPRALLLTHIHLDHAGASGVLCRRFPALRVYVHEVGAPHMIDPEKLLRSATRLYGDQMERLWGEVAPVPAERLTALGESGDAEGLRYVHAPGHASHHVAYLDEASGDAYVGDVGGVRIPPSTRTFAPTPPPDIDQEAWLGSLDRVASWKPSRLHLTHFGAFDADQQLEAARVAVRLAAERSEAGDREAFMAALEADLGEQPEDVAARFRQAAPPDQLWQGMERYWRKRHEREAARDE
jgi:glyoxylase-like metal-dependent hydrolase (beta-lactamase superfamily II)